MSATGRELLIVEDDAEIRLFLKTSVTRMGQASAVVIRGAV